MDSQIFSTQISDYDKDLHSISVEFVLRLRLELEIQIVLQRSFGTKVMMSFQVCISQHGQKSINLMVFKCCNLILHLG